MYYSSQCSKINQSMEKPPSLPSYPLGDPVGGAHRGRDHHRERDRTDGDERTFPDIVEDVIPRKELVKADVRKTVLSAVEEREQAGHPAKDRVLFQDAMNKIGLASQCGSSVPQQLSLTDAEHF
jgi:hypothetical protein